MIGAVCMAAVVLGAVQVDKWSGLEVHPAVLNSVMQEGDGTPRLSLGGEWEFWKSPMQSPGACVWREMKDFSKGSVMLVLASEHYNEADYIRDHNEFLRQVGKV